jgi:hypothetical protein
MLNHNVEKAIFIVLFAALFWALGSVATGIKENVLGINQGKTPEQVIEEEYPELEEKGLQYRYVTEDDFLFVCYELETGYCQFNFAYRTDNSGYFFQVPGLAFGPNFAVKPLSLELNQNELLYYSVYKVRGNYFVEVADLFGKRDIQVLQNGEPMEALTFDNTANQYWAVNAGDLDTPIAVSGRYKGKEFSIINTDEIIALYGVNQHGLTN